MKTDEIKNKLITITYILEIFLALGIVYWLLSHIKLALIIIVLSIFLTYLLNPFVNLFSQPFRISLPRRDKKISIYPGLPRVISIILVYLIVIALIILIVVYIYPILKFELDKFIKSLPALGGQINNKLELLNKLPVPKLPEIIKKNLLGLLEKGGEELQKIIIKQIGETISVAKELFSLIIIIFIVPLFTFYILLDIEKIKSGFVKILPAKHREEILKLLQEVNLLLSGFIRGQLIVCACIGFSITIALLIWRIDYALLIGVFAGVVDIIPYVGVIMGMIPAALLALSKSFWTFLGVVITLEAIHWLEAKVLMPNVIGPSVHLSPLTVLIAIFVGAELMGIIGIFIAIPIAGIIKILFNHFFFKNNFKEEASH